jgi:DNA invertase Pin-like site-specific DNA recombinase
VEEHHLYLRADGCPDDLTVFLCSSCHGRAHGLARRIAIGKATKVALAAAKARGVKLGNPSLRAGTPEAARAAAAAKVRQADDRAADLAQTVAEIRAAGIATAEGIAKALNARGIPSPSGRGAWHPTTVSRLVRRQAVAA